MDIIRFAILGLGTGAIYALLAQGLVLVYRGSGILNFAQGAMAMTGAYAYYDVKVRHGWPSYLSVIFALLFCAVVGALIHLVILRPMRRSSPLSRVIATLAVTLCLQSIAFLRYGHNPLMVPSLLPRSTVDVDGIIVGKDQLLIFVIGLVLTVALAYFYRVSHFGRVTTAVAENQVIPASLGHSPDAIAAINWALGSALAALAGILIVPLIYLEPTTLVLLVLPAMGAGLLGQFSSFSSTFLVAIGLGVAGSEIGRYVSQPGWASAAPFIVVVIVLLLRGQVIPLRSMVLDRLPAIGTGRVRPVVVLVIYGVVAWIALAQTTTYATALVTTMVFAIICLSVVVITGYAGQLSLAQVVIAGVGALGAAQVAKHLPFIVAVLVGAAIAGACGAIVGIPALRTRGVTLAIVTLGLGSAIVAVVFTNLSWTGGTNGIAVPPPKLFGWSINPLTEANRYAFVVLTVLVLLCLAVANLRRGAIGRRLIALRSNERATAALGLPAGQLKGYAFTLSAAIAGIGGIFLAFVEPFVQVVPEGSFTVFMSVLIVAVTVVGGIGMVGGALIGAVLVSGGIVNVLLDKWINIDDYLPLIGGISLLFVLITEPSGLFEGNRRVLAHLAAPLGRLVPAWLRRSRGVVRPVVVAAAAGGLNLPMPLTVRGLSVSFGGVHAVRNVDIEVLPGQIHGLIGPNGAGKTTVIDAITGFVRAASGTIVLGERDVGGLSAPRRARAGLSRSFQSLELFDDLTILENLAVASERPRAVKYLTDLVWPGRLRLTSEAMHALEEFELVDIMHRTPADISFGQRKAVAIARAVAAAPSVLLLDEPAAGLDDHEVAELSTLIRRVAQQWGIGILLIEHKVDMIMGVSDRITVLQNGAVLASGGVDEIMTNPAVVEAYLGAVPVPA